jgi:hypothetical protein
MKTVLTAVATATVLCFFMVIVVPLLVKVAVLWGRFLGL